MLKFMKPPRYSIVKCEENSTVKSALDAEGMLGISIDEIQTTKDFEILGHIAAVRRQMGIALAPQIADYAADFLDGSDEKLVIFGWHIDVLTIFEQQLHRFGTVRVDGSKTRPHGKKRLTILFLMIRCAYSFQICKQAERALMVCRKFAHGAIWQSRIGFQHKTSKPFPP